MFRFRQLRPSDSSSRRAPRPRLFLEPLEARRMLSAAATGTTITPNITTADLSGLQSGETVGSSVTNSTPATTALTPSQIATAYSISLSSTSGSGETIAIVDAYNDPNIKSDLAVFDSQYNLPAANLTVENESGQTTNLPRTDAGWSAEIALDVEWAHAAAPGAKIVLVEASSTNVGDLMAAVQTAAKQANVVSMSWGGSEFRGETAYDTAAYFANPNVTFVAASGDDGGAAGAEWPAVSPDVVSVGGTTLSLTSSGSILSETAWSASGSRRTGYSGSTGGTSLYESVPSYQAAALGGSVSTRATPDVAADANPNTGLSVYDSVPGAGQTGWFQVGGTSAGAPIWAGIIAAADQARAAAGQGSLSSTQTLSLLYSLSSSSSYSSDFHDITSGSNFVATAKKGYDMVTGLGSPVASNLIAAATTYQTTSNVTKSATPTATTHVTTPTTPTTTHAQVVSSTSTSTTAVTTSPAVGLLIGPVTTTNTSPEALATSVSASASNATVTTASASASPARPVQSLPQSVPALLSSPDEVTVLPVPETTSQPGLFLEPAERLEDGAVLLASATRPTSPVPVWDAALDRVLAEEGWIPESETFSPPASSEEPAMFESTPAPNPAALLGLSLAIWGTWEYRSRRSSRERRRRSPGLAPSSV